MDIRDKMQRLCDASGPQILLHKDRFDPNASFNVHPSVPKMLGIAQIASHMQKRNGP